MNILTDLIVFYFGAIIGSFLNVVVFRLPLGLKLFGRSHCVACGEQLSVWELFPIFSFILLGGKCKHCGKGIALRYLLIELASGALFFAVWSIFGMTAGSDVARTILLVRNLVIVSVLLVVFVIDLQHYLILDSVVLVGAILVLVANFLLSMFDQTGFGLRGIFVQGLLGAAVAILPFYLIWKMSSGLWLGFGDVKLSLFLGLALGWPLVAVGLLVAVFLGGLVSFYLLATGRKGLKSPVPFGTFLSLGTLISLFYGQQILNWYLSILGL